MNVGQSVLGPGSVILFFAFFSGGLGQVPAPTGPERAQFFAANAGLGAKVVLGARLPFIALEYAHGFSGYPRLESVDRINAPISLRFLSKN